MVMRKYRNTLFSILFYSYIILFFILGIIMILFELDYLPTNIENRIILFIQENYYSIIRRLLFLIPLSIIIGLYYKVKTKKEDTLKSYEQKPLYDKELCFRCGIRKRPLNRLYCNTCDDLRMGLT